MSDIALTPKNPAVVDRLRRRLEGYRKHHDESIPHFEKTVNGLNEDQKQQTLLLRQRYVESKAKKPQKKSDKKHQDSSLNNSSKPHSKRQVEESSDLGSSSTDNYEPPKKMSTANGPSSGSFSGQGSSPSKAQSRAANKIKFLPQEHRNKNGLQQTGGGSHMSPLNGATPTTSISLPPRPHLEFKQEVSSGYGDSDQSKDLDLVATLENGPDGMINPDTLNDLISEILNPDFMKDFDFGDDDASVDKSDNSLVGVGNLSSTATSNSTNPGDNPPSSYPVTPITPTNTSAMHHQQHPSVKLEGTDSLGAHMALQSSLGHQCAGPSPAPATTASPLASQLTNTGGTPPYATSMFDPTGSPANSSSSSNSTKVSSRVPYNSPAALAIDSPAAQTLKQMAEQHQHKAQMGLNSQTAPGASTAFKANSSPARSPFSDSYGNFPASSSSSDFMGATSNVNSTAANTGQFPSRPPPLGQSPVGEPLGAHLGTANVKQEVYSPTTQTSFSPGFMDVKRGGPPPPQQQIGGHMSSHNVNRMQQQQQVLSPVSKSFNHSAGMEPSLITGQSFMPRPPNSTNANPSNYPSFPTNNPGSQQIANSSPQQQMAGRGSPSGPIDSKVRMGLPPQQQQQQQQSYYYSNNNMHGGVTQGGNNMDPQFNMQGMQPNGPQGQTINFTQQHLRVGGPAGGNMAPRMTAPPTMNRIPGPGPPPRIPQQQQQPTQQQMMMRQQHMAQQQAGMSQPGMMNRFPGPGPGAPNPARGPNMQQMMNTQPQQMGNTIRSMQPQQHQQTYGNNGPGGQQMISGQLMGPSMGNSAPMNMHMRQNMSPYNNGNHNMMTNNGPPQQSQQPNMQMNSRGGTECLNMDPYSSNRQYSQPPMTRQGSTRPNMQMPYHSGMPMQMQQQQPGMMGNSYVQSSFNPQMGYNPQMQQISGFNQNSMKMGNSSGSQPPPQGGMYSNSNFMKPTGNNGNGGMMCSNAQPQQQQQMFGNNQGMKQMGMSNEINIDQMINNLTDDTSGFSAGDTAELFHSLDSNSSYQLSNILDNL